MYQNFFEIIDTRLKGDLSILDTFRTELSSKTGNIWEIEDHDFGKVLVASIPYKKMRSGFLSAAGKLPIFLIN